MTDLTEGERYLIERIRARDAEAWSQLMDRFQGRLLAFARSRSIPAADADDLVQETFVKFLHALPGYRQEASLETFLFMILRRRIIDHLRGKKVTACLAQEDEDGSGSTGIELPARDLTASAYARRDERLDQERAALAGALSEMIDALKSHHGFRDLKIIEALFYAQLRNKDIGPLVGMDEKAIALIKHRWLKALRGKVEERLAEAGAASDASALETEGLADSLLTEIWEEARLTCPKRSTLGGYLLKTLDAVWQDYVHFHTQSIGCRFCRANLDDLQAQSQQAPTVLRERVMQSTAGFFKQA